MRINEETVLVGEKCAVVPYRKEHVEKYHEWMKDPQLQEQTASEPLSLEEEYEMAEKWRWDEDKLTFIILEREKNEGQPSSVEEVLTNSKMAGDVNLFLYQEGIEGEGDQGENSLSSETRLVAECEVMIAEPSSRRKGIAKEALTLLIHYASSDPTPSPTAKSNQKSSSRLPIDLNSFIAKISIDNQASRALFEQLGFKVEKVREVWREVEVRLKQPAEEILKAETLTVLEWNSSESCRRI